DGSLARAARIPGESNPRSRIEQVAVHATIRCSIEAAADQSQIANDPWVDLSSIRIVRDGCHSVVLVEYDTAKWRDGKPGCIESCGFPIPGIAILFVISAEQADTQSKVQG